MKMILNFQNLMYYVIPESGKNNPDNSDYNFVSYPELVYS